MHTGLRIRAGCAALLLGSLTSAGEPGGLQAEFDWFEYRGNDAVFETPLNENQYRNPVIAGFYPDPSVVRAGEDFYLVNSSFGFYPGIPVFHSRNLVDWVQIGNVIDRPGMVDLAGSHLSRDGLYAPTIEFHDGLFYVANTCVRCGGNYIVTSDNPAGPWSDPVWLPDVGGIDPSMFFEDGRVYVLNNNDPEEPPRYNGHRAIWIREVDPETYQPLSERRMLVNGGVDIDQQPVWIEGPHLYKVDGKYYLWAAEGGTELNHRQVVFRSDDIYGPYAPWKDNPVLTQRGLPPDRPDPVTSAGHADLVTDPSGNWWAVFLATRNYDEVHFNTGRETFLLAARWKEGWPHILEPGREIPYAAERPRLPAAPDKARPTTGNFVIREQFDGSLPDDWLFIRIPGSAWWQSGGGRLTMAARSERIGDAAQPSIVARRLQHMNMTATVSMHFAPRTRSDEAGLVVLQSDDHYFAFGIGIDGQGRSVVRLRHRDGEDQPRRGRVVTELPLQTDPEASIRLRVGVRGPDVEFAWSEQGGEFVTVYTGPDGKTLSSAEAGGFVGSVVGMYAESGD